MHSSREKLPREFFVKLLRYATSYTKAVSNIIEVHRKSSTNQGNEFDWDVTVVGDLHGQFDDAKLVFTDPRFGRLPSETNHFIFNGDVVDRGKSAMEILSLILLAQVLFPGCVHYIRGNHECANLTAAMGFQEEVVKKYDIKLYDAFLSYFNTLPVAAVIEDQVFVVHGGISRESSTFTIGQLNSLDRHCEPNLMPLALYELLWAGKLAVYNAVKTFATCDNCALYLQIPRMQRGSHRCSEPQREQWTASDLTPRLPS
jgi:hypothetical protein